MRQLELYEFGEAKPLPAGIEPTALRQYLRQVWQNRSGWYQYGEEDLPPLESGQPFLLFDEDRIRARNYAGIIHFQGTTFYLLPKLFERQRHSPFHSSAFFSHLSFYLSYCRHIHFPFQWQQTETIPTPWLPHWMRLFASFASATLAEQPYLTYQTHQGETAYLRGKLAVQPYLNEQIARGQWQRLQTEQQPFELDNGFNQIVKYTASRLETIADAATKILLQDTLWLLADVQSKDCTVADCEAVHLNRLFPKHQEILDMCRFFLAGEGVGGFHNQAMNFAFLVPMERIFEDLVTGFIHTHYPEWQAEFQKSVPLGIRSNGQVIQVRPDIWLPHQRTVWDTKYKLLGADEFQWEPISSDLYQMMAYASACQTPHVHLLYAAAQPAASETIQLGRAESPINVSIHFLPLVLRDSTDTFSALTLRLKETFEKIALL